MEEVRVIYFVDDKKERDRDRDRDQERKVPYLVKLNTPSPCLSDFKKVLNSSRPFKYYVQTTMEGIG